MPPGCGFSLSNPYPCCPNGGNCTGRLGNGASELGIDVAELGRREVMGECGANAGFLVDPSATAGSIGVNDTYVDPRDASGTATLPTSRGSLVAR